jgi:hypothetical protein
LAPEESFSAVRAWRVLQHAALADEFREELERLGYDSAPPG